MILEADHPDEMLHQAQAADVELSAVLTTTVQAAAQAAARDDRILSPEVAGTLGARLRQVPGTGRARGPRAAQILGLGTQVRPALSDPARRPAAEATAQIGVPGLKVHGQVRDRVLVVHGQLRRARVVPGPTALVQTEAGPMALALKAHAAVIVRVTQAEAANAPPVDQARIVAAKVVVANAAAVGP